MTKLEVARVFIISAVLYYPFLKDLPYLEWKLGYISIHYETQEQQGCVIIIVVERIDENHSWLAMERVVDPQFSKVGRNCLCCYQVILSRHIGIPFQS